ncbi:MAG: polysaccharide deacetylase family protein [Chloroflexi bacterium]|nr:polysaccharide deacetylase family protein [Chloroflexota bacterium]
MSAIKHLARPVAVLALLSLAIPFSSAAPILAEPVISTMMVGSSPRDVATNPITNRIYVANASSNDVSVIDGNTHVVVATIPISSETFGFEVNPPFGVALNPTTNRIYVAVRNSNSISVIDGDTNTVVSTIPVDGSPISVAVNPTTNRVYAINEYSDTISVIDGSTNTVVATVAVGDGATHLAVNSTTNHIYLANNNTNAVSVMDGDTNTILAEVPVGEGALHLAVNHTTNRIYVTNNGSDTVSVMDGNTRTVVATIPVGRSPVGVAVNPTTNRVYAANDEDGGVSVIDGNTNTVMTTIPVVGPLDLAVNPTTNRIYVTNDIGNIVTSIEDVVGPSSPPSLPRAGGMPIEDIGLIGLVLTALGVIIRRLSAGRSLYVVSLCFLLAIIGTSVVIAGDRSAGANAIDPAPYKKIALTFDDGYNSRNVNLILDTLENEGVRATFFPVGVWVQRDPATFRRIAASHEVGDHTFSHPLLTRLSDAAIRREILDGVKSPLFRPPYGALDDRVRAIVRELGLRVVLWNVDSRDWTGISPELVTSNVVRNAGDGKIVIMHMGNWNTVRALPRIIAQLRAEGFAFVTVSELGRGGGAP